MSAIRKIEGEMESAILQLVDELEEAACDRAHEMSGNRELAKLLEARGKVTTAIREVLQTLASKYAEIERLKAGLKWYADGNHFVLDDDWDTVSDEPQEWLCGPESGMIEDGGVARTVLAGGHMVEGDDDLIAEPLMTPEQHKTLLARLETLIIASPAPDSLEGMELLQVAGAVERYEKRVYPDLTTTPQPTE